MTDADEPRESEQGPARDIHSPRPARWRLRWETFERGAQVLAAVGAVATVIGVVVTFTEREDDPIASTSATPPASTANRHASSTPSSRGPRDEGLSVGDCLDDRTRVVRCDAPHSREVISVREECNEITLVQYLGGTPRVDIVLPNAYELPPPQSACVVNVPDTNATRSVKDVLLSDDDDAWRICIDHRTDRTAIPCSDPHTGEWVLLAPPSDAAVDCTTAAETYMGAPPQNFAGKLTVLVTRSANGPKCAISVLGRSLLTGSVRRLGTSSLPVVPE